MVGNLLLLSSAVEDCTEWAKKWSVDFTRVRAGYGCDGRGEPDTGGGAGHGVAVRQPNAMSHLNRIFSGSAEPGFARQGSPGRLSSHDQLSPHEQMLVSSCLVRLCVCDAADQVFLF